MKSLEFPIIGTKVPNLVKKKYDLASPSGRKTYFEAKAGDEIKSIKKYLRDNTFIGYLLGKKNSGKGTYAKLFIEIFGGDKVVHLSIGDIVRDIHQQLETKSGREKIEDYLKKNYRGYISVEAGIDAVLNRSTEKVSVPDELMLALIKMEIDKYHGKALFIDGFPRTLDQVSYSLFFRDLMGYREDPDFFVLIDIPEAVIDERIKYRRVCPECQTSRNLKLNLTSRVGYDKSKDKYFIECDNPDCSGPIMVAKEGDSLGLEPIRARLDSDEEILRRAFALYGVPKILLRNHVPVIDAQKYYDNYEITPEYVLTWNAKNKQVKVTEKAWTFLDDNEVESHSLLAAPVVVTFIKQLADVLDA